MDEAEKEETPSFSIELNAGTDLTLDDQRCFNGGYLLLFLQRAGTASEKTSR